VLARAAAVAIGVGALVAACGGGSDPLSASEFRSKASTHCARLKDASDELAKAQAPSATGKTVSGFLRGAADGLRSLVDGLDGLEPPKKLERDADALVSLLDEYAGGLDELAGRVRPGDTLRTTFERNAKLVQRLNGAATQATTLVTRLQLAGCMLS
jgi:hypothetical protein